MEQRLRAEQRADGLVERRPAALGPDSRELGEHVVQPLSLTEAPEAIVELRDEPGGQPVLRCADRVPRRERCDRHVPERLVDELTGLPESVEIDSGLDADPGQRLGQRFRGRAVERQRNGVDRAGDRRSVSPCDLERSREGAARGALAVEADRQAGRLSDTHDHRAGPCDVERTCRIVDDETGCAQLGNAPSPVDELVVLVVRAPDCEPARRRGPCPLRGPLRRRRRGSTRR